MTKTRKKIGLGSFYSEKCYSSKYLFDVRNGAGRLFFGDFFVFNVGNITIRILK